MRQYSPELEQAQQLEGSVFDDLGAKLTRAKYGDSFGGMGVDMPSPAMVINKAHPAFQNMVRNVPKFAGALEKMPQTTEYLERPAGFLPKTLHGVTMGVPKGMQGKMEQELMAGRHIGSGDAGMSPGEMERMVFSNRKVPGASAQIVSPGQQELETAIHEGLHSLYQAKNPDFAVPNISDARARELMMRVLGRSNTSPGKQFIAERGYYNEPQHGLVEALSQFIANKRPGGMTVGQ